MLQSNPIPQLDALQRWITMTLIREDVAPADIEILLECRRWIKDWMPVTMLRVDVKTSRFLVETVEDLVCNCNTVGMPPSTATTH